VAGIVIGVGACIVGAGVGGKKTYDYWSSRQSEMVEVEDNPLYVASQNNVDNPLFELQENKGV